MLTVFDQPHAINDAALPLPEGVPEWLASQALPVILRIASAQGILQVVPGICGGLRAYMLGFLPYVLNDLLERYRRG